MEFREFYENLVTKQSDFMRTVARPLRDALDVDYFSYQKVDRNGKYAFLTNWPDYLQFYMDRKFYNLDTSLIHPDFYPKGETVLLVNQDIFNETNDPLSRLLRECVQTFDFRQTIQLTHKTEDAYESFCFSSKSNRPHLLQNYVNQLDLFRRFITYFKKEAPSDLSWEINHYGMDLTQMKGDEFQRINQRIEENLKRTQDFHLPGEDASEPAEKAAFLELASRLTERERESLRWIVNGKTAYEAGIIMGISQRTVERHLDNSLKKLDMGTNRTSIAFLIGKHGVQL